VYTNLLEQIYEIQDNLKKKINLIESSRETINADESRSSTDLTKSFRYVANSENYQKLQFVVDNLFEILVYQLNLKDSKSLSTILILK